MIPANLPPPDLRPLLPNPNTPWLISPTLFQKLQGKTHHGSPYHKTEITSQDPEWKFLLRYFEWQKPTNRSIGAAYCIHNPSHTAQFEANFSNIEQQAQNPAFAPKWSQESNSFLRKTVIKRWEELTAPYTPFTVRQYSLSHTKIVPLWHGTKEAICNSICSTGFTTFGKHALIQGSGGQSQNTDIGYFGSGIYFTTSAQYAADIYSDGNLLVAWVSMREPYPVIADGEYSYPQKPQDMKKLEGLGAYENYNAHYIPVVPIDPSNPQCAIYYPCADAQDPVLDELVVFSPSQTLARFWIQLQVDLLKAPTVTTVHHLLEHILNLLEKDAVKLNPHLLELLEQKTSFLITLNSQDPLAASDQEFYNWAIKLLDETGKVRNFVLNKLQQIHGSNETAKVDNYALKKLEPFSSGKKTAAPQYPSLPAAAQPTQNILSKIQGSEQNQNTPKDNKMIEFALSLF